MSGSGDRPDGAIGARSGDDIVLTFGPLLATTQIRVADNLNNERFRFDDPERIRRVVAWFGARDDGWSQPPTGVVVSRLKLQCYVGDAFVGALGIGSRWLTAQLIGEFFQRPSSDDEFTEIIAIVNGD